MQRAVLPIIVYALALISCAAPAKKPASESSMKSASEQANSPAKAPPDEGSDAPSAAPPDDPYGGRATAPTAEQSVEPTSQVEVCPTLGSTRSLGFWSEEGRWPTCAVAAPIVTIAGRCLGERGCMRPCAVKVRDGEGKVVDHMSYEYDDGGHLIAVHTKPVGNRGGIVSSDTCLRDAAGHLTSCKLLDAVKCYFYQDDKLTRSDYMIGGRTSERQDHQYDRQGRLVLSRRISSRTGEITTQYRYASDGTLATLVERFGSEKVTIDFTYERGRLVSYRSESTNPTFFPRTVTYRYDRAGRVIAEQASREGPENRDGFEIINDPVHGKLERHGSFSEEVKTYAYDRGGRLVKEVRNAGDFKFTTSYDYACKQGKVR